MIDAPMQRTRPGAPFHDEPTALLCLFSLRLSPSPAAARSVIVLISCLRAAVPPNGGPVLGRSKVHPRYKRRPGQVRDSKPSRLSLAGSQENIQF